MNEPYIRFSHVGALMRRYWIEYRRALKAQILVDVVERFLFFVAFGYGLGRAVREIGGFDYLTFLAPGIVTGSCMFVMVMAMTYGVFERSKDSGVWSSYLATPIKLQEILLAEMTYASMRSMPPAIIMYAASYGLGAQIDPLGALVSLPLIFVLNYVYGAIALCIGSQVKRILYFGYVRGLFMMPMYLFSGVFFDITNVPTAMSFVAHIYPLTYVIDLIRPLVLGQEINVAHFALQFSLIMLVAAIAFRFSVYLYRRRLFV